MYKKIFGLTLAAAFATQAAAFAGSAGDSINTSTTSSSTSTSTTSSTSNSTSDSFSSSTSTSYSTTWLADNYHGSINLGYQVQGICDSNHGGSGYINYYYRNTNSGLELLTQGANLQSWGDANAWNPVVYVGGRTASFSESNYSTTVYGNISVATQVGSSTSQQTSYQTSQQTTQQTSQQTSQQTTTDTTVSNITIGDFVIGTNTNVNTNVNTNTNTNVNTNVNTHVNTNVNTDYNTQMQNQTADTYYEQYYVNQYKYVSPIALDLSGTGRLDASEGQWLPHTKGIVGKRMAMFDIRGNGFPMAMEWVGPNAGLLIEPRADGTVDGTCLFGEAGGYSNGYEKLALRDKNNDGVVRGKELEGLAVWRDTNGNAKLDKGELLTMAELKITEIGTRHKSYKSTFVMNGKSQTTWDWFPTCLSVRKTGVAKR